MRWSNLPNGQAQQFQVRARNRGGWGGYSSASAAVDAVRRARHAGSVGAQRGDGSATVTWAAPYDQGCAISGYTITSSGGGSINATAARRRRRFPGLSNGTTYTFTVVARNEVGDSAASAASNPVIPAGPPGAPQIIGRHDRTPAA